MRYHWHSMDTCTTEISHQLISWDIIDIAWILVPSHHITSHQPYITSHHITIHLEKVKIFCQWPNCFLSVTQLLTSWIQEMLAHLKTIFLIHKMNLLNFRNTTFEYKKLGQLYDKLPWQSAALLSKMRKRITDNSKLISQNMRWKSNCSVPQIQY